MDETVRRLGCLIHIDPYDLWVNRSPRQIFQLVHSYNEVYKSNESYENNVQVGVKIPSWYKVKPNTKVFDVDKLIQGNI